MIVFPIAVCSNLNQTSKVSSQERRRDRAFHQWECTVRQSTCKPVSSLFKRKLKSRESEISLINEHHSVHVDIEFSIDYLGRRTWSREHLIENIKEFYELQTSF